MMRLSESIRKDVLKVGVGSIVNRFKMRKRRDTLFFEDIIASYFEMCEEAGYFNEMKAIAQQWMSGVMKQALPAALKMLSPVFIMNNVMRNVWINLGMMEDIRVSRRDNIVMIKTRNEFVTRVIGVNAFAIGSYKGVLNVFSGLHVEFIGCSEAKRLCTYLFRLDDKPYCCEFKEKELYNRLNHFSGRGGFSLRRALEMNVLQLGENNRLYFRGKSVIFQEQTMFHIIGNSGILLSEVPRISYDYFSDVVQTESDDAEKLVLLKTLLQMMGWGEVSFRREDKCILMEINNPPYGLQLEKDNWEFLIRTVLGYLWLIDDGFRVGDVTVAYKCLRVNYCTWFKKCGKPTSLDL